MSFKPLTTAELVEHARPYPRTAYACLRLLGRRVVPEEAPRWAIREPSEKPYLALYFGEDPMGPGSIGAQCDGPGCISALLDIALWDSPGVVPELLGPLPAGAVEGLRAAMAADIIEELAGVAISLTPMDWINGSTPMMRRWRNIRADSRELVQTGLRVFTPAGDVEAAVLRRDVRGVLAARIAARDFLGEPVQPEPEYLADKSCTDLCALATNAARGTALAESRGVNAARIVREVFSEGDK